MKDLTREDDIEALAREIYMRNPLRHNADCQPIGFSPEGARYSAELYFKDRTPPAEQSATEVKRCYHLLELTNALGSDVELGWKHQINLVLGLRIELDRLRSSAPALPTDRMGWLELWLRCCHALDLDGSAWIRGVSGDPEYLLSGKKLRRPTLADRSELTRLQFLAAELLASDAKDGGS